MSDIPESVLRRLMPGVKIPSREEKEKMDSENLKREKKYQRLLHNTKGEQGAFENRCFQMAKQKFLKKDGLKTAVEKNIFSCVVSVKTEQGMGTGFFEHENWLVSNAHVLPNSECVKNAIFVNHNFKKKPIELGEQGSFHRPITDAPDIAIINIISGGAPVPFAKFLKDEVYEGSVFFYIFLNHYSQKKEVRFLIPHTQKDFLLLFKPEDKIDVEPGCSGSPVFQALICIRFPGLLALCSKSHHLITFRRLIA